MENRRKSRRAGPKSVLEEMRAPNAKWDTGSTETQNAPQAYGTREDKKRNVGK